MSVKRQNKSLNLLGGVNITFENAGKQDSVKVTTSSTYQTGQQKMKLYLALFLALFCFACTTLSSPMRGRNSWHAMPYAYPPADVRSFELPSREKKFHVADVWEDVNFEGK
ncbi:unnamed protein product [Trichobilharzia szidati]|nr:unnamed protein product [Trichobilharzia szidati]